MRQRYQNAATQANQRQSAASTNTGGAIHIPGRAERASNQSEREYKRWRKADEKAHHGTHAWPGGYRGDNYGKVAAPDGTIISPGRKH